jgi:hypothetical protein
MNAKCFALSVVLVAAATVFTGGSANAYIKCDGKYASNTGATERMGIAYSVPEYCSSVMVIRCRTMHSTYCWKIHTNFLEIFNVSIPPSDFDVIDTIVSTGS